MNITNNFIEEINNITSKSNKYHIQENNFSGRTYTVNSTHLPLNVSSSSGTIDEGSNERKDFKLTIVHSLFEKRELELPQVGSFSFSDSPFTLRARLDWLRPIL